MKTLTLWVAAVAACAPSSTSACSPSFKAFSDVAEDADFAFLGRARVRFKHIEEPIRPDADEATVYVGEAEFSGIECYKRPKGERRCPRNLTVPFTVYEDGHNCPPWVLWYKPKRERYFTLWRDEAGNWQLGGAWRRFGRR